MAIQVRNTSWALFLISVLALFLELLLIRWISTEINIFAYLQNTVLIVCFLGLGMGCLTSRKPARVRDALAPLLILVLLLSIPISRRFLGHISLFLSALGDFATWNMMMTATAADTVISIWLGLTSTFVLMFLMWGIFITIGRFLGQLIDACPSPMWGYSVNVAGSLIGVLLFVLLGAVYQPPPVWLLIFAGLTILLLTLAPADWIRNISLLSAIVIVSWFGNANTKSEQNWWSPYQKLTLTKADPDGYAFARYRLTVNNSVYQWIVDLAPGTEKPPQELSGQEIGTPGVSQYDIPALLHPKPRKYLVVGSGTGNDVAAAVRQGVAQITAVEIDPAIIRLGRLYHPERPYESARVEVVSDDARSFFMSSKERYDVISFGLLDSHTATAMTNARLDHYVYTKESLTKVKALLADDGIISLIFEVRWPFIGDRIATLLREVFREEPLVFRIPPSQSGPGGVMFISGNLSTARKQIESQPKLLSLIADWQKQHPLQFTYTTDITTDDWPYLYLDSRRIPILYYLLGLLLFALFFYTKWRFNLSEATGNWTMSHWHFFFLGAAFLLLEIQNISKASVVLGNTWQVNAVIISGILIMILFANLVAATFPNVSVRLMYIGLIGSCVGLYFIDLAQFASLPYGQKAGIVGALTALPVFFSGIVFIRSFASVTARDKALGANLMGSLVGGLLQSITFVTGIQALLIIVAMLYIAAMTCDLLRPRQPPT